MANQVAEKSAGEAGKYNSRNEMMNDLLFGVGVIYANGIFGVIMQYNRNNMQKMITFAAVLQKS